MIVAPRILLIDVPNKWLWKATQLAEEFVRDYKPADHIGPYRAIGLVVGSITFFVWSSRSGKQVSVRYFP